MNLIDSDSIPPLWTCVTYFQSPTPRMHVRSTFLTPTAFMNSSNTSAGDRDKTTLSSRPAPRPPCRWPQLSTIRRTRLTPLTDDLGRAAYLASSRIGKPTAFLTSKPAEGKAR